MSSSNNGKGTKATNASQPSPKPPKSITLARDGDIVLLVGLPPSLELTVSFAGLTRVSPVFRRMLTGRFAEGQAKRSAEDSQHIALPDDDAKAISDLCHLLYHRVLELSSAPLIAQRLFNLVSAMDKYDCLPAFHLQIRALMDMHFDNVPKQPGLEQAVLRAATTHLLRDEKFFKLATKHLIVHFNSFLSGSRNEPGGETLPTSVLLALAEKRSHAQRVIGSRLGQGGYECSCGDTVGGCEYHDDLLGTFGVSTWPPEFNVGGVTVAQIVQTMKMERALVGDDFSCCGMAKVELLELADEVERICEGLCIECARVDAYEVSGKTCKHAVEGKA